jgi:type II secretion system protein H
MKNGFTLLELLVVLIIISLVSAFVIPRLVSPINSTRLKTTVNKVSSVLRQASNIAATEKKYFIVLFDLKNNRLCMLPAEQLQLTSILEHPSNTELTEQINAFYLPKDIRFMENLSTIEQIDADAFIIYFFPNGTSSGGQIVLSNDKSMKYKIKVDFITSIIHIDRI